MPQRKSGGTIRKIRRLRNYLVRKQKNRCHWCHVRMLPAGGPHPFAPETATLDHIVPYCEGGATDDTNCVAACHYCNNARGNRPGPPPHVQTEQAEHAR